jgi:hypothetical protein
MPSSSSRVLERRFEAMKAEEKRTLGPRVSRGGWRWALTLSVSAMLFALPAPPSQGTSPCKKTANDTLKSCRTQVVAEYWLAAARCENLALPEERQACKRAAIGDKEDGLDECKEMAKAREDLCDELGGAAYRPPINPADFVGAVDHPYFPLTPGTTAVYESQGGGAIEHIEVTVTHETTTILGVPCVVVRDTVSLDGSVVEDTRDFFAQDRLGNVWYFGEVSVEYRGGDPVSLEGSWRAGEEDAQPGIIMQANPAVGGTYRQEYAIGEAEDIGKVFALGVSVTVPYGSYEGCLVTEDTTPMDPDALERKYYAPGIGLVRELDPESGETIDLIEIRTE